MIPNKSPTPRVGSIVLFRRNGHQTPALVMKLGQNPLELDLLVFVEGLTRLRVQQEIPGTGTGKDGGWSPLDTS